MIHLITNSEQIQLLAITLGLSKRSPKWPALSRRWLILNNFCAACGTQKQLTVHHVHPFHLFPELELDPENLITLCEYNKCHLRIGHSGDWRAYNPHVCSDSALMFRRKLERLYQR